MNKFIFIAEQDSFEGVKRIAQKVARDFEKVIGVLPAVMETFPDGDYDYSVIFATLGKSPLTEKLINEGKFDPAAISGKREVYQIKLIDKTFVFGEAAVSTKTLLICGSDILGTIYGMFAFSEYIGVSPLCFWGDVEPVRRENIQITAEINTISHEPDVKYRGFFINDEWPCFGNWTFRRFGGFTAEMYDHVFELLLRLKGNFLWPAMWSSSFALDGPGNLNEELADIYGIAIGSSHHEPCLRASEEWDKVRGSNSEYGSEWNYAKNKNGLLKYCEDGLKRSGKYKKIITIGMRGERDSSMLGDDATLEDNINLLKEIITNQRELIKKHVNINIVDIPQVLALYKEVEEYFNGSENTDGLKNWEGINGVICMLCEDNFGFLRTLPAEDTRNRKGGFGMYYHFDYHGSPISYEWMPSASFERTWEQMCTAYDYGIRDIWIVNAGDLKFNETPLNYFMELAYDFKKWGTNSPNSIDDYTAIWLEKNFPAVNAEIRQKMAYVFHSFIRMNAKRRPEALNADIYHPCHYLEADRMLALAEEIEKTNQEVFTALSDNEKTAYQSMIYFPAKASVNLLRMHLYAVKNKHYANQGKKIANKYADLVTECIEKDRALSEEIASFRDGKWKGMELAPHIGFVKWNEDNCRYPLRYQVEPACKPRLVVSRKDRENIYVKTYGSPETIFIDDFLYEGNEQVILEIANDGIDSLEYTIEPEAQYDWLEISSLKGIIEFQEDVTIRCNRKKLAGEIQSARILIKDKETVVMIQVRARAIDLTNLPPMTFLENNGVITMEANHYCGKKDVSGGGFVELENYGRSSAAKAAAAKAAAAKAAAAKAAAAKAAAAGAMKVFPTTSCFKEKDEKPELTFKVLIEEAGVYEIEVWTTPTNPSEKNRPIRFQLTNSKNRQIVTTVSTEYRGGNPSDRNWHKGVLDNIRITKTSMEFEKGVQEITIGAMESGLILERILIYAKNKEPLKSYLGPTESFFKPN